MYSPLRGLRHWVQMCLVQQSKLAGDSASVRGPFFLSFSDHNWGHCQSLYCFVSRICTSLTLGRKSLLKWGFWTTPLANLGKNSFAFHISLSSFCRWTGTNLEGDLVWAVPTLSSIFVCIVLKDNTSSVIKLSKTGSIINRTEIGLQFAITWCRY